MSDSPGRLLVADDDPDVLAALRMLLRGEGYEVETATSPALVLHAIEQKDFDLAVIDMNYARDTTSGGEGLDLLERLRALDPALPVVVLTAWGSVEGAVAAVRRGARDYVLKPWDNERLLQMLQTQLGLARALKRGARLGQESRPQRREGLPGCIAESPAMRAVIDVVQRAAAGDTSLLVAGEPGTGKDVLARLVHALSPRANRPLVFANLGAVPDSLFEAQLAGIEKGAMTGSNREGAGWLEQAEGGTLFLDGIHQLSLESQERLLRTLQAGEFARVGSLRRRPLNVRLVSGSQRDLRARCAEGRFREDLLLRLGTVEIDLPPLRDRREDIPAIAAFYLEHFAGLYRKRPAGFTDAALQAMLAHPWPGNVRELVDSVDRAVLLARGRMIDVADLHLRTATDAAPPIEQLTLDEAERLLIQRALDRNGGNVSLAAKSLGLSRSALYRRLERHGIRTAGS